MISVAEKWGAVAKVTWNTVGTRLFHAGVDRGMLYIDSDVAVPWSGLLSITEAPSGGDPQPYFLDGQKVLNIAAAEEFAATIETLAAPLEFAVCAGRLNLSPGLFASDQFKKSFTFSYRTLIGNDVLGTAFAYKVHVIFNALAAISDFSHGTIGETPSPGSYSIGISTSPVVIAGYKPTAHLVFDSRLNSDDILTQVEAILYGDDDNDPRMPTAAELVTLLTS